MPGNEGGTSDAAPAVRMVRIVGALVMVAGSSCCLQMTANKFAEQFETKPRSELASDRTLVHLGLPGVEHLVVWYGRGPKISTPPEVQLSLIGPEGPVENPTFIHQPMSPAGRIRIMALRPDSQYEVRIRLDGQELPPLTARTAPELVSTKPFSFLAYSCFSPFSETGEAVVKKRTIHELRMLGGRAQGIGAPAPSFVLGTGDQVYVDEGAYRGPRFLFYKPSPRAMLTGNHSQTPRYSRDPDAYFATVYRSHLGVPPLDQALGALPSAMMWDDHDIRDGWGSQLDENARDAAGNMIWLEHLNAARRHFLAYQMLRNPAPVRFPKSDTAVGAEWARLTEEMVSPSASPTDRPDLHFSFDWGAATSTFVMDLRSQRSAGGPAGQHPRVISQEQLDAFTGWLAPRADPRPRLYVLVSSMPLTHGIGEPDSVEWKVAVRSDDRRDNWWSAENRAERDRILEILLAHFRARRQDRLLILSGDVHFAELLTLSLDDSGARRVFGHEVISSGLAENDYYSVDPWYASYKHRRQPQGEVMFLRGALTSTGAGARLFAPHFAELFVDPGDGRASPRVELLYYPAANHEGGRLVNRLSKLARLAAASGAGGGRRLELPLDGAIAPPNSEFFKRFMLEEPDAPEWDADADDWHGYE
jgi:phosphodiesterase/alkaline phosphatase D-like protein